MQRTRTFFVVQVASWFALGSVALLVGGAVRAAPAVVAGPVEVSAPDGQRGLPVLLGLVEESEKDNTSDRFRVVALPPDRSLAAATTLAVLPDIGFSYTWDPNRPQQRTRAHSIMVDSNSGQLFVAICKAVGNNSHPKVYIFSVAPGESGQVRLEPIANGVKSADSPTVEVGLFPTDEDQMRGPIRFIDMAVANDGVRVVTRVSEEDDAPAVYEVRKSADNYWHSIRVGPESRQQESVADP